MPSASTAACQADSRAAGTIADGEDAGVARDQPASLDAAA